MNNGPNFPGEPEPIEEVTIIAGVARIDLVPQETKHV